MKVFELTSLLLVAIATIDCNSTEDYVENAQLKRIYKLKYKAETWEDAREVCKQDSGKLAVPKSEDQFKVIQKLVRGMRYPDIQGWTGSRLVAWLGITNKDDYRVWRNLDGEDIETTGITFASGHGVKFSDNPKEPHCAVVDSINPMRDFWCDKKQPFVCEYPLNTS